jgi:hypothetical protein
MAPGALQRTPFQEYRCADAWPILQGVFLNIADQSEMHAARASLISPTRRNQFKPGALKSLPQFCGSRINASPIVVVAASRKNSRKNAAFWPGIGVRRSHERRYSRLLRHAFLDLVGFNGDTSHEIFLA